MNACMYVYMHYQYITAATNIILPIKPDASLPFSQSYASDRYIDRCLCICLCIYVQVSSIYAFLCMCICPYWIYVSILFLCKYVSRHVCIYAPTIKTFYIRCYYLSIFDVTNSLYSSYASLYITQIILCSMEISITRQGMCSSLFNIYNFLSLSVFDVNICLY